MYVLIVLITRLLLQLQLSLPRLVDLVLQARFFSFSLAHLVKPGTIKPSTHHHHKNERGEEHKTRWLVAKRKRGRWLVAESQTDTDTE